MTPARFLVTAELGRLARWLRLLGHDTEQAPTGTPRWDVLIRAMQEERTVLTRDRRYGRHPYAHVVVEHDHLREQLAQVISACRLKLEEERWFTRCVKCNRELEEVPRERVLAEVPEHVGETTPAFFQCPACRQLFWEGSHVERVQKFLRYTLR